MLNHSASLGMSTNVLIALPGKLDIKRHSPNILYFLKSLFILCTNWGSLRVCPTPSSSHQQFREHTPVILVLVFDVKLKHLNLHQLYIVSCSCDLKGLAQLHETINN